MSDPISKNPNPKIKIGGEKFKMGTLTGDKDEQPVRVIEMSPFLISKNRISGDQYRQYIKDYAEKLSAILSGCKDPTAKKVITAKVDENLYDLERRVMPLLDGEIYCSLELEQTVKPDRSVGYRENQGWYDGRGSGGIGVTHAQAQAYCEYYGGELPTAAQVEIAQKIELWGRGMDVEGFCEYHDYGLEQWEWTSDHYQPDWYEKMPSKDPHNPLTDPTKQAIELRRGPADFKNGGTRMGDRTADSPDSRFKNVGFRCVWPVDTN